MARIPYKAYDNKWKYGKALGLTLAFGTGAVVMQQIKANSSSLYVMKDGYDSPMFGIIFVVSIILFFYSSYKNKEIALVGIKKEQEKRIADIFNNMNKLFIEQENKKEEVIINKILTSLVDENTAQIILDTEGAVIKENQKLILLFMGDNLGLRIEELIILDSRPSSITFQCTLKQIVFVDKNTM